MTILMKRKIILMLVVRMESVKVKSLHQMAMLKAKVMTTITPMWT